MQSAECIYALGHIYLFITDRNFKNLFDSTEILYMAE